MPLFARRRPRCANALHARPQLPRTTRSPRSATPPAARPDRPTAQLLPVCLVSFLLSFLPPPLLFRPVLLLPASRLLVPPPTATDTQGVSSATARIRNWD